MIQDRRPNPDQMNFLHADLLDQLNPKHPLLKLARHIPWDYLKRSFPRCIPTKAGPPSLFGSWWVYRF